MIHQGILEKHAILAKDLWLRRTHAVTAPNYTLNDLARVDGRLEANLDALRIADGAALELCMSVLNTATAEGAFVIAYLALQLGSEAPLEGLTSAAVADPEVLAGLIDGLCFATAPGVGQRVSAWLASQDPATRRLGLEAAVALRVQQVPCLDGDWPLDDAAWLRSAARAVGVLGLVDQLPQVYPLLQHGDLDVRAEAALAVVRLRGAMRVAALALLDEVARLPKHPRSVLALCVGLRARDHEAEAALETLLDGLEPWRAHVALAAVGTPSCVERLVVDCTDASRARSAAHAFALITGVDFAYADLDATSPAQVESPTAADVGETDAPEDPGQDFVFPDAERVSAWWERERARFGGAQRFLGGHPISVDGLRKVLQAGSQPMRVEASWELGLRDHAALINTALPARLQRRGR